MSQLITKQFRVVAVSNNRNSFGLSGLILIAQDGEAWEVGASQLCRKAAGDEVLIPVVGSRGRDFAALGYEIPCRLPKALPAVIAEVWGVTQQESGDERVNS